MKSKQNWQYVSPPIVINDTYQLILDVVNCFSVRGYVKSECIYGWGSELLYAIAKKGPTGQKARKT